MKYFSLLLLAVIATQANGKLICADKSEFCKIVTEFDGKLTWEKSKLIDSNKEYKEQNYEMSLQTDGDTLISSYVLPKIGEKYKKEALKDISEEIVKLAQEIKNPSSNLYKIAKSVGRIDKINDHKLAYGNIPGMGTATLVKWKDMPPTMTGRVVLTCLHNHNYSDQAVTPFIPRSATSKVHNWRAQIDQESKKYEYGNKNEYFMLDCNNVYFTPDESNDKINVRGYGKTQRSIEVSHCYYKAKDETSNHDIAIFILKNKVDGAEPVEIFQYDSSKIPLKDGDKLIGVGYGRSNAYHENEGTRFLEGWNIKKKINATCAPNDNSLNLQTGFGYGDSGSLLFTTKDGVDPDNVNSDDLIAIGVVTGGVCDPMLYPHMEWMKASVNDFAKKLESEE